MSPSFPLVFTDASSAILLYKTGLFLSCTRTFTVTMAEAVFREVSVPGYPGAGFFRQMNEDQQIRVLKPESGGTEMTDISHLDIGERETLSLFLGSHTPSREAFIIMDDGKGARYCYSRGIPFINALLVPKIFWYAGRMDKETYLLKTRCLAEAGRYSNKIIETAGTLTRKDLARFIQTGPDESRP